MGGWFYFEEVAGQSSTIFYDYLSESWITPYISIKKI